MDRGTSESIGDVLATLVGGVGGALLSGLLVRLGVKPLVARAGLTVAGGAGAVLLPGRLGCASGGAAVAGVSQLVLGFLEAERMAAELPPEVRNAGAADTEAIEPGAEQDAGEVEDDLSGEIDQERIAQVLREELGEPQLVLRFCNGAFVPKKLPSWIPMVGLVGLAVMPLILQRIAG